ncbi:MAG: hypothetical protein M9916_13125, partial [Crocinitomicaceae bacterium]|nr:hypothetical protein [Crocinitomicaceae bacterium]
MQSLQLYVTTTVIDITNYINPSLTNYSINPLTNLSPSETPLYSDFYILVLYENNLYSNSCVDIYINNRRPSPVVNYLVNPSNILNINDDIGLSVHSSGICNNDYDRYEVLINGLNIGSIGGQEDNTDVYCAGVIGSFYYQNNQLFGIGNDVSNTTMNGLDAIAKINSYITNQNINVKFEYTSNVSPNSNLINQLFLTYTSPCHPFNVSVTKDTTICKGSQFQLIASEVSSPSSSYVYEWKAPSSPNGVTTGLSCTNCPNPIFTADSSMFYTVRIWNNDT